jgi:hypothetical protein
MYHGLGVNVAAPAIKTKCKLFLYFCTVPKKIDNLLHLQQKDFSETQKKSVKNQRCRLRIP